MGMNAGGFSREVRDKVRNVAFRVNVGGVGFSGKLISNLRFNECPHANNISRQNFSIHLRKLNGIKFKHPASSVDIIGVPQPLIGDKPYVSFADSL